MANYKTTRQVPFTTTLRNFHGFKGGLSVGKLDQLWNMMDKDNSQFLEGREIELFFDQVCHALPGGDKLCTEKKQMMIKEFDKNGDGMFNKQEMSELIVAASQEAGYYR